MFCRTIETSTLCRRAFAGTRVLLATLAAAGCSGTARSSDELTCSEHALSGGNAAASEMSIFALSVRAESGTLRFLCTATLLGPNLLLTAQHCVAKPPPGALLRCGASPFGELLDARQLFVSNAASVPLNGAPEPEVTWHAVAEIHIPTGGRDVCGFDLALLRLEVPIVGAERAALEPALKAPSVGAALMSVGYGDAETVADRATRRISPAAPVDCVGEQCGSRVGQREFSYGNGLCDGDSGGPALDAERSVVGVLSRSGHACGSPVLTAVDPWSDFLRFQAQRASRLGGFAVPAWAEQSFDGGSCRPHPCSGPEDSAQHSGGPCTPMR